MKENKLAMIKQSKSDLKTLNLVPIQLETSSAVQKNDLQLHQPKAIEKSSELSIQGCDSEFINPKIYEIKTDLPIYNSNFAFPFKQKCEPVTFSPTINETQIQTPSAINNKIPFPSLDRIINNTYFSLSRKPILPQKYENTLGDALVIMIGLFILGMVVGFSLFCGCQNGELFR